MCSTITVSFTRNSLHYHYLQLFRSDAILKRKQPILRGLIHWLHNPNYKTKMSNQSNNKTIAKNTVMLYIRMLLSIVVSLYTSRVVLHTLGVEDFGIYGVVGGVVSMFAFLNGTMSGATSRFLMLEMGKGNFQKLRNSFISAMTIHIGIALAVFFLSETVGLWFLCSKLVIPEERMFAAHIVFQCSILGMFVNVTQVPYNSAIIAHEKMDVYAYVELLNVFLKLGTVYLLLIGNFDKLILYAALVLSVNILVAMTYRIYCLKHYEESHLRWVWDKDILKAMTSYSVYNLLGNFGYVFNQQSINFLLNMFFGVVLNAASSVATTVSGVVQGFVSAVITAFRPPIIKSYAQEDYAGVERLFKLALKSSIIINSLFTIPLLLELDTVLQLWLGLAPEYTAVFCRIILISMFFDTIRFILIIGIHAVGRVRNLSIVTGLLYAFNPFLVFICLKCGLRPEVAYLGNILVNVLVIGWSSVLLSRYISQINVVSILSSMIAPTCVFIGVFTMLYFGVQYMEPSFLRLVITTICSSALLLLLSYTLSLTRSQRAQVNDFVVKKIHRR
jgi:O-antigen/teichoic acid export membrane protein